MSSVYLDAIQMFFSLAQQSKRLFIDQDLHVAQRQNHHNDIGHLPLTLHHLGLALEEKLLRTWTTMI